MPRLCLGDSIGNNGKQASGSATSIALLSSEAEQASPCHALFTARHRLLDPTRANLSKSSFAAAALCVTQHLTRALTLLALKV